MEESMGQPDVWWSLCIGTRGPCSISTVLIKACWSTWLGSFRTYSAVWLYIISPFAFLILPTYKPLIYVRLCAGFCGDSTELLLSWKLSARVTRSAGMVMKKDEFKMKLSSDMNWVFLSIFKELVIPIYHSPSFAPKDKYGKMLGELRESVIGTEATEVPMELMRTTSKLERVEASWSNFSWDWKIQ